MDSSFEFFSPIPIDIEEIDRAIGGGLIRGTTITIMYDAFSLGWALGFEIFKNMLFRNSFGVIHNYSLPVIKLISRASFVGLNLQRLAREERRVKILDIFGSKYDIPPYDDYVITIPNPTEETLTPKIERVYEERIYPIAGEKRIVKLIYTLDGVVTLFDENVTIKLLNAEVAHLAKVYKRRDIISIFLLNMDVVSRKFVAWVSGLSDVVIVFNSRIGDGELVETMSILKSPNPDFEPSTYEFKIAANDGAHSLSFRKSERNA
ncbi:hypothetical protein A3L04_03025 [Thermococcus chitonophagus]|uniref:KaiC-like domain-containing protein n=1 Tax=Thermococcus chitonophagus TaxID=54262 RepID=A0A161KB24_9EURY|nr:hypothetical protein [Thermococcus chitonophagus]ASJ16122.1 hypothetical protein A3L04_03025 [Thermococcus chitonophagus]CUX78910.1 hypothetical protein CHITON_2131 [Thermococcus chitonophagus]